MDLKEAYDHIKKELYEAEIEEFESDAGLILSEVTGKSVLDIKLSGDKTISSEEEKKIFNILRRRKEREPLQFILGYAYFMGHKFSISKEDDTLIPRFDTEILCEEAEKALKPGMNILDIGTGTGCILISLMACCKETSGIGVDISKNAIACAERNARNIGVSDRCSFLSGDLYEALPKDTERFDMIVSNPPYIKEKDIKDLTPEVRDHEPMAALSGGEDGLAFYRRIIEKAPDYLKDGGHIFLEIGYDEGEEVSEMLKAKGFSDVRIKKDLSGLDRVVTGIMV